MLVTKWMGALFFICSLCAGVVLAAEIDAAQSQSAIKEGAAMDKPAATLGGEMDGCPMHKPVKEMAQGMGKEGEHCQCPHDKMHQAHTAHMSAVQDKCELHNKEKCAAEKDCKTMRGEKCPFPHDAKYKPDHKACDPAKEAANISKESA